MNLALWLDRHAKARPDAPAILSGTRRHASFGELAARAAGLAGHLRKTLRLNAGDRVLILARNHPAWLEGLFGIWWAGLVAVPVNAKLHAREVAWILAQSGARTMLITSDWAGSLDEVLTGANSVNTLVIDSREYSQAASAEPFPLETLTAETAAWLFYTSGTTGRPKGATLTHGNLAAMCDNYFAQVDGIAQEDCILHAAPLSHGSGLYALPHLLAGAAQVVPESGAFDENEIVSMLENLQGVTMFAAPTMVKRLVQHSGWTERALAGLKTIVYGGGPMYVADALDAMRIFAGRLVQIYGQGETPMTITVLGKSVFADSAHARFQERLASVGVPFSGVEVEVRDESGQALPAGEVGEICVRGATVMAGYWNQPEATAATLRDGWLWTGDLGSFDADGFLTLKDRSKDLIISGGSNIYPREVEEVLLTHPDVVEVSVIGQADAEWGENVVAFVVGRNGFADAAQLDAHCLAHIARFKRPKLYRFVDALPKNAYGKVLKTALRDLLRKTD